MAYRTTRNLKFNCFKEPFRFADYLKLIKFLKSLIRFHPRKKNYYWLNKATGIPYQKISRCLNVDRIGPRKNNFTSFELVLIFEALLNEPYLDKIELTEQGITFYSEYLINSEGQ